MDTADIISLVGAVLGATAGAFLGFIYQTRSDLKKSKKDILTILMAFRGKYQDEPDFRHALNTIDVVFYKNREIRAKRIEYLTNLQEPQIDTGEHVQNLIDLILLISADIGYNNLTKDDVLWYYHPVKRNTSSPEENAKSEV